MAVDLARLLAPFIVLSGLAAMLTMLHANQQFAIPAFAALLYNVGAIGGALLLGNLLGIRGLIVGIYRPMPPVPSWCGSTSLCRTRRGR